MGVDRLADLARVIALAEAYEASGQGSFASGLGLVSMRRHERELREAMVCPIGGDGPMPGP